MTPRRVAVVAHTHWDREWYAPFQTFRMDLVGALDSLLDLMEADHSYRHFLLDGQMAVIDDYLEVRPECADRLRQLRTASRLWFGPWTVLMDEFLVSGETIVRNLQTGMARGAELGGAMDVGYLPDMFGHIAQMPQLLSLAGIDHAVVWRGVPSTIDRSGFTWRSPDGSEVRAEYLMSGYGNGAALPDDAKALVRRLDAHLDEVGAFLAEGDPLLLMNGTDHHRAQPWIGRVVDEVNRMQSDYELSVSSLPGYLHDAPSEGLPAWEGELRSGARANLLMGVGSNRVDVKQAASRAERVIERLAEPLSALLLDTPRWPGRFLELAWTRLIHNAAHDSVCACSADEVVDAVLHRYAEAHQIGAGLVDAALAAFGATVSNPGPVAVNPSHRERGGMVELVVTAADRPGPDVQVLSERFGLPGSITLDGSQARSLLGLLQGSRVDGDTFVIDVSMDEDETGLDVTAVIGTEPREGVPIEAVKRDLYTRLAARPDTEVRIHLDQPPIRRVLARQRPVPGFGWAPFAPARLSHPVRVGDLPTGSVAVSNGLVDLSVDPIDGTFSIDGRPGFGQLVDGGDHGDTYNYSPPAVDSVVDSPESVEITIEERGPVRAIVTVHAAYVWPDHVDDMKRARVGSRNVDVVTTIEVGADDPAVRVHTRFVNPCRDHRLRVHLPLPQPALGSRAECAFDIVERGLFAEGRIEEAGLPTYPSRRFVSAGGLTVVHEGLLEYELIEIASGPAGSPRAGALALTLLRATGMLSRIGMATRPLPAGPLTPLRGSQCLGEVDVFYALQVGDVEDPYRLADDVLLPLIVASATGGGDRSGSGVALSVSGAEVSAVRRVDDLVEVRVFNPADRGTTVEIPGRSGCLVDLRGRRLGPFAGSFDLRPHGIATVRLDPA